MRRSPPTSRRTRTRGCWEPTTSITPEQTVKSGPGLAIAYAQYRGAASCVLRTDKFTLPGLYPARVACRRRDDHQLPTERRRECRVPVARVRWHVREKDAGA